MQIRRRRRKPLRKQHDVDPRTRKCIATGAVGSPEGYARFVLSPDGIVTPDFTGRLPGRGAWVAATRDAIDAALKNRAFSRSFRKNVAAPDDLSDRVEAGLAKAALSALGLARKAGDVVTGFEKVRAALKRRNIAALIAASDGSENGKRKLNALSEGAAMVAIFTGDELSAALGRDGVVHVALKHGPAAKRFLREARRLGGFRGEPARVE